MANLIEDLLAMLHHSKGIDSDHTGTYTRTSCEQLGAESNISAICRALRRIPTVFKKKRNRPDKNLKYLDVGFDIGIRFSGGYIDRMEYEDDDGDACSISTVSTNATMDNNPGTGRVIDNCIYQFLGRKIERFANRISISFLSPAEILRITRGVKTCRGITIDPHTLAWVLDGIGLHPLRPCEPGACLAGWKSLVRQSQSNSLYRSAAALAALVSLSTSWDLYTWFYEIIAAVEPIFHLEALALDLSDSHPEKKYYLSLTSLARAQLHYRIYPNEVPESLTAFNLQTRRSLLDILESQQSIDHDPLAIITDACSLFSKCYAYISRYFSGLGLIPDLEGIIETAYLLAVTFARSFIAIYHQATPLDPSIQRLRCLILSTYVRWVDDLTFTYLAGQYGELKGDLKFVQQVCKLRGPLLVFDNVIPGLLTPLRYERVMCVNVFPRRIQIAMYWHEDPPILRNFIKMYTDASVKRACRLFSSLDELKQEVRCSMLITEYTSPKPYSIVPDESYQSLLLSLDRARQVQVCKNRLTARFLCSRAIRHDGLVHWQPYRMDLRARRLWGEELCSNLDWDWDPSSSLKRLFKIDRKTLIPTSRVVPNVPVARPSLSVSAVANGPQITVFINSTHANIVEKVDVRITNRSEDSETEDTIIITCSPTAVESGAVSEEGGFKGAQKATKPVEMRCETETMLEDRSIVAADDSQDEYCHHSTSDIGSLRHHDTNLWFDQKELGGLGSDVMSICSLD